MVVNYKIMIAMVEKTEKTKDNKIILYVKCPNCHQIHKHGSGSEIKDNYGFKMSHCLFKDSISYKVISIK